MQETIASYDAIAETFADRWFDLRLEDMARFPGGWGQGRGCSTWAAGRGATRPGWPSGL